MAKAKKKKAAAKPTPKAKPKPKPKRKPKPKPKPRTLRTMLDEAARVTEPLERAALIETMFDEVSLPSQLVERWFEASLELPGRRDATAVAAIAMAHARSSNSMFLDAVGAELARRNFDGPAIEVFRLAIAAGSQNHMTNMLLGYLLVRQNNEEGVALLEAALQVDPRWTLPRQTLAGWYLARDPARVLTVLAEIEEVMDHELRSMAFEKLGAADSARVETGYAIANFASEVEALRELAAWCTDGKFYDRAYDHARALVGRTTGDDDIDEVIVTAYRNAGQINELVPWLRERTQPFPLRLGFYVFTGLTGRYPNPDVELSVRAARDVAAAYRERGDVREARLWRIREAGVQARAGDLQPLDDLVASGLDDDPAAWVEVAYRYIAIDHHDAGGAAADRALELDPNSGGALVVSCILAMRAGDSETLHRVAMALLAQQPTWHEGPEFLARSFARRLDVAAALMHSERTLAMAAYCHNAWTARAEALLVAGDFTGARTCIDRALLMRTAEPGDDAVIVLAALERDRERMEKELAKRFEHLSALPFQAYVERLRAVAEGSV